LDGQGVLPDIKVEYSLEDEVTKMDLYLGSAEKLIFAFFRR
jgi:hypothetical protein